MDQVKARTKKRFETLMRVIKGMSSFSAMKEELENEAKMEAADTEKRLEKERKKTKEY